jgi:hypothetical protein
MSYITTFEILDDAIKNAGGKPTVLEAFWDGDTQGWHLELSLYTVSGIPPHEHTECHSLGMVGVPEGMNISTNGLWTEAVLAEQFGNEAAQKYDLTFYFPSKKDADPNCPAWTQRYLGIECADCSKLIIPTDSPYLPKDICYHCHLTRESNEDLIAAKPSDEGVNWYLYKDDEYLPISSCSLFESFVFAPFINEKVKSQLTKKPINIVQLGRQDIADLKIQLEAVLSEKLSEYEKPVIEEEKRRFFSFQTRVYKGKEYELAQNFNYEHIKISALIDSVETAEKALAENYIYQFYFKNGFTYRYDSVLRFVRYVSASDSGSITDITNNYANILTESEVLETLRKLEQLGCVKIDSNEVRITDLGRCVL